MSVGTRMKERRKALGYSVEDIAARLGKSPATIYRYESGDIEKLPGELLAPLADILNTSPAYLMGWEEQAAPRRSPADYGSGAEVRPLGRR